MTKQERSKALQTIRDHAAALNAEADKAAARIKELDAELQETGAGVEVFLGDSLKPARSFTVTVDGQGRRDDEEVKRIDLYALGYARVTATGRFALAVRTTTREYAPDGYGNDWDTIDVQVDALASCDRGTRLLAVKQLPDLLDQIADELARLTKETKEALGTTGAAATK